MLDPARSRGGIFELELALDAMDSHYNDLGRVLPVNTPNAGGALPGFDEDVVVEVFARVDRDGVHPEPTPALPRHVRGLIGMLAEYQWLAAEAAWEGDRRDAIRALASPSVDDLDPHDRGALRRDGRGPPGAPAGAALAVGSAR